MKIERIDGSVEQRVLTSMIIDNRVLTSIAAHWTGDDFSSKWANLVGRWCINHHRKYNEAPGKRIQSIFESWAPGKDQETVRLIEKLLINLSNQYDGLAEESNSNYMIDLAGEHFNRIRLSRVCTDIEASLSGGSVKKALECYNGFTPVQIGVDASIDLLNDQNAIIDAFADDREPLIVYPGPLGEFYGRELCRDAFIAFEGINKRGKTFVLLDVAWRAMEQRHKVAFIEIGDLSKGQIIRRFMMRAAKQPLYPRLVHWPIEMWWDKKMKRMEVESERIKFEDPLDWRTAWKACETVKSKVKSRKMLLRLLTYASGTVNMNGIKAQLQKWSQEDWVPDVVVIDYADLLAPLNHRIERRFQIGEDWSALRALSQTYHCLVVTATQANAKAFNAKTLGQEHFSDSRYKRDHVTGTVSLNQSSHEEECDILRMAWTNRREEIKGRQIYVARCLSLANSSVRSCW